MALTALALNCSLKSSDDASSTDVLLHQLLDAFREHDVTGDVVRVVDHDVRPGVTSDEGEGDAWPALRRQVLAADILVLATPIWLGKPSSVCSRVLERMDAFLGEEDDRGRIITSDRVAVVVTVGNEDGAHHVAAELYQSLADVGFTIPASAQTYWVGEAMQGTDYKDLDGPPDAVASQTRLVASNAAHLARILEQSPYPPSS
ncbi:MAG: NAD(P)H-dependent oxidoreductase [Actinomycetota bacterium]|nr:NAD(P)H-dependent oxidoreductase [Actinomycetota bacterium]